MSRSALFVVHTGRSAAMVHARRLATELIASGFEIRVFADECEREPIPGALVVTDSQGIADVELVVALGGDGTLLRAAHLARPLGVPLLGVNLGHVGFLAEAQAHHLPEVARRIADRDYEVEERLTLDVTVREDGVVVTSDWALNEVSVERSSRERILEALVSIDGDPVSKWGCDGVLVATPTGSTAYAFSAGGPVLWPNVAALLVVPVSAHALFNRPLVVGVNSVVTIEARDTNPALISCDGRKLMPLAGELTVAAAQIPVRVIRLRNWSFTDRLVAKFGLDVAGWRSRGDGGHFERQ